MPRIDVSSTPNPNSLKFTVKDTTLIESGMESFGSAEEAAGHDLGERIFGLPGVINVFILPQFMTVTKTDDADWGDLVPEIERAVNDALGG